MQNLADMAGCFGAIIVRVEEREARGDIQEQHAAQQGQRWPRETSPENRS
jgi:hypothetical protein